MHRNFIKEIVTPVELDIFKEIIKNGNSEDISQFKKDYVYPRIFSVELLKEILEYDKYANFEKLLELYKKEQRETEKYLISELVQSSLELLIKRTYTEFEKKLKSVRDSSCHFYFKCKDYDESVEIIYSLIKNLKASSHSFGVYSGVFPDIFDIKNIRISKDEIRVHFSSFHRKPYFFDNKNILGSKTEELIQTR